MNHKIKIILIFVISFFISADYGHAESSPVSVNATVVSRNAWCSFSSESLTLDFGAINPSNETSVTATASVRFHCFRFFQPTVFAINDDGGLYETGPNNRRMRNTNHTSEYLPYSISLTPKTGTLTFGQGLSGQDLTISGTVLPADYKNAYGGDYGDTVRITISP